MRSAGTTTSSVIGQHAANHDGRSTVRNFTFYL